MGRGCPPPQPTRGSGERRKLPQRGPGRSPGRKRVLEYFEVEKIAPDSHKSVIFDISTHISSHIYIQNYMDEK